MGDELRECFVAGETFNLTSHSFDTSFITGIEL